MDVSTSKSGAVYGVYVGDTDRDEFFERGWDEVEIEVDGMFYPFKITPGFWDDCPEIRDPGRTVRRDWLSKHLGLPWKKGEPPHYKLLPLGDRRFRLVIPAAERPPPPGL